VAVAYGMPVALVTAPSRLPSTGPHAGVKVGAEVMAPCYELVRPEEKRLNTSPMVA
jgi:hypothetical protein